MVNSLIVTNKYLSIFVSDALKRILSDGAVGGLPKTTSQFQATKVRGNRQVLDDYGAGIGDASEFPQYETPAEEIVRKFKPITTNYHFEDEQVPGEFSDEFISTDNKNDKNKGITAQKYFWEKNQNDVHKETKPHAKNRYNVFVNRVPFLDENYLQETTNADNEKPRRFSIVGNSKDDDTTIVQDTTKAEIVNELLGVLEDSFKKVEDATEENTVTMDKSSEKAFIRNIFNDYVEAEYWHKLVVTPQPSSSSKLIEILEDSNESDNQHTLLSEFITKIQTKKESKLRSGIATSLSTEFGRKYAFSDNVHLTTANIFSTETLSSVFTSSTQPKATTPEGNTLEITITDSSTVTTETIVHSLSQNGLALTSAERTDNLELTKMSSARSKWTPRANDFKTTRRYQPIHLGIFKEPIQFSAAPTTITNTDTYVPINETPIFEYLESLAFTPRILSSFPWDKTKIKSTTEKNQAAHYKPYPFDIGKNNTAYLFIIYPLFGHGDHFDS